MQRSDSGSDPTRRTDHRTLLGIDLTRNAITAFPSRP
jgi:hypothetical protein